MIKIYIYGCTTCGINAVFSRKIQRYGLDHNEEVSLINTKYDQAGKEEHIELLRSIGLDVDTYQPLVIYNGEVRRLRSWTF